MCTHGVYFVNILKFSNCQNKLSNTKGGREREKEAPWVMLLILQYSQDMIWYK